MRGYRDLDRLIEQMPDSERSAPFSAEADAAVSAGARRDRDVQDVVNHLHAWHVLLLGWLDAEAGGDPVAFPAPGHSWGSLAELNAELRDRYRLPGAAAAALDQARVRLRQGHVDALARIETIPDDDLFEPGRHGWLAGALAEPVHECLGGHYAWAVEVISTATEARA